MVEGITREQFGNVIQTIAGIFKTDIMSNKLAVEAFYDALSDLPYDAVKNAVRDYLREAKFPPTPADIREWADKYIERPEAEPCDEAKAAYERYFRGEEYKDEEGETA